MWYIANKYLSGNGKWMRVSARKQGDILFKCVLFGIQYTCTGSVCSFSVCSCCLLPDVFRTLEVQNWTQKLEACRREELLDPKTLQ